MKTILLILSLHILDTSFAQDTAVKEWKFTGQLELWYKWQGYSPLDARVVMPDPIKKLRQDATELPTTFDTITDNPLAHAAAYLAFKTRTDFKNKIFLFADLYGEHRGTSYGIFNSNNTVIYPVVRLEAVDTLTIFSKKLMLRGKAGQFLNERLNEGLTIYNLDLQGFEVSAKYETVELQYTQYGDLYNGIGLNTDELIAFSLQNEWKNKSLAGISWVIARPGFTTLKNNFTLNFFVAKSFSKSRIYAQFSYRPLEMDPLFFSSTFAEQSSALIGWQATKTGRKMDYSLTTELRYYGFAYNFNYYSPGLRYREPVTDPDEMYANTVGEYLYPLRKYETPFSQWAVFTEYGGYNCAAASISGKMNYHFTNKFDAVLDWDLNYIYANQEDDGNYPFYAQSSFIFPFFNAGLCYKPAENTCLKASVVNKAMNLDIHYPTHYLLKKPCFELSLFADFN